jgi:hypothetical protein
MIIEAKIRLASFLKWDTSSFEIDIVHPSVVPNCTTRNILQAISDLKQFVGKKTVTYGDILNQSEIVLSLSNSEYKRICYRIIAFIRDFSDKCLTNNFQDFEQYPSTWNYTSLLKPSENASLQTKSDNEIKNLVFDKDTTLEDTTSTVETPPETSSGLEPMTLENFEINPEKKEEKMEENDLDEK